MAFRDDDREIDMARAVHWGMILAVFVAGAAQAAERRPLDGLYACLDRADAADRAACLEGEARRLREAERRREVVVLDRAQERNLRQRTAASPAPSKEERPAFVPIDTTLTGVQSVGGKWLFTTQASGDWIQAEAVELGRTPRVGDRFRVRRGMIGGFLANIGTGPAIRVRSLQ